jgi:hypothetical protein
MARIAKLRPWTKDDVRTLKTLAREKTKTTVIARQLRRSVGATYQKARALGVTLGEVGGNEGRDGGPWLIPSGVYQFSHCGVYSAPIGSSLVLISGLSCKTMFNNELWTSSFPLYSIKPNLRNLFMKKLTRARVVPIISASVS